MELGYILYPPANPGALGHPRLDVNLYPAPTGKHFDPREITLPACDPYQGAYHLTLFHPADTGEYQVCIGRIILVNFSNTKVEIFSFGGHLQAENQSEDSHFQLTSPAPIFDLGRFSADQLVLVSEYESQLALLKAAWRREDLEFEQRLAEIDPLTLFVALTAAVENRLHMLPINSRNDNYWKFQHTIHAAIRFINPEGVLPTGSPTVQELFMQSER